MTDNNLSIYSYEDVEVPGLDFKVKATSTMNMTTTDMNAVFEVQGGKGRITIEYDNDPEATIETDLLIRNLYSAVYALTARMMEEVMAKQLLVDITRELGGEAS